MELLDLLIASDLLKRKNDGITKEILVCSNAEIQIIVPINAARAGSNQAAVCDCSSCSS